MAPFNGAIDLTVSGSAGPFTYSWTGPGGFTASTEDISNLQDGAYNVTVTDVPSGCTASANINVNNTAPTLSLSSAVTANSRCVAPFNGAIDLTVSGSAGPFTYSWTGPGGFTASTEDISNLQDGAYSVTVTDVPSGCTASANINVNSTAPALSLSSAVTANSRCVAPFNGAIDLTVSGSAGPFTYSWTGPGGFTASTEDISNLQDGAYSVTVTDVPSGCTALANINVNSTAPALSLSSAVTANSRCVAPFNGAIDLTVSGSAGPFTYSWTGPGGFTASTEDISNLQDGAYSVTVTDVPSGCTALANINVNSTAPALSLSSAVTRQQPVRGTVQRCHRPDGERLGRTVYLFMDGPRGLYGQHGRHQQPSGRSVQRNSNRCAERLHGFGQHKREQHGTCFKPVRNGN
ncbi:MAG: hypothetical protein KatS3mg032_0059 [Cyclobacteriaceae bacterium]|nr:MAG: hypothetical protein KatS3mg032_0059 [Cyclobacteriaceae bacterium]